MVNTKPSNLKPPEIFAALDDMTETYDMICAEAKKRGILAYELAPMFIGEAITFFADWHAMGAPGRGKNEICQHQA